MKDGNSVYVCVLSRSILFSLFLNCNFKREREVPQKEYVCEVSDAKHTQENRQTLVYWRVAKRWRIKSTRDNFHRTDCTIKLSKNFYREYKDQVTIFLLAFF